MGGPIHYTNARSDHGLVSSGWPLLSGRAGSRRERREDGDDQRRNLMRLYHKPANWVDR